MSLCPATYAAAAAASLRCRSAMIQLFLPLPPRQQTTLLPRKMA